jgi:hypothetical protein
VYADFVGRELIQHCFRALALAPRSLRSDRSLCGGIIRQGLHTRFSGRLTLASS